MTQKSLSRKLCFKAVIGFTLAFVSACTVLQIELDPNFRAQAHEFTVSGRQGLLIHQRLSYGPYTSGVVDRDWNTTSEFSVFSYHNRESEGGFRFSQRAYGRPTQLVDCSSSASREALQFGDKHNGELSWLLHAENRFDCRIHIIAKQNRWQLAIGQHHGEAERHGALFYNGQHYDIDSLSQLENTHFDVGISGYQVSRRGQILAALETLGEGRVWLHKDLTDDEASLLAAAVSTLLLYEAPENE
jgi:hypothetical protein